MKNIKLTLLASALFATGSAMAAVDGNLGTDSTGTSVVTIVKQNAVQVTKLDDIVLGTHATLAADESRTDDVCVFNSTATYQITISSANAFELRDGANAIPYSVDWATNGGTAAPVANSGDVFTGQVGDQTSLDCNGGTNASYEVTVAVADFNSAAPGSYTDTITLFVEPE